MLRRFWSSVLDYRFDPFFLSPSGVPLWDFAPWLFPRSRAWCAAFWFAFLDLLRRP